MSPIAPPPTARRFTPATRRSSPRSTAPFAFVDLDALRANAADARPGGRPADPRSPRSRCARSRSCAASSRSTRAFGASSPSPCPRRCGSPSRASRTSSSPTRPPTARRSPSWSSWPPPSRRRAPVPMVDGSAHLDLIEAAIGGGRAEVRVCLDVDVGWWPLGGRLARIGPKRSPVHDAGAGRRHGGRDRAPARHAAGRLMAYEGHIAGRRRRDPGRRCAAPRSAACSPPRSATSAERLPRIVDAVREQSPTLEFVNGGGTGSLARTAAPGRRPSSPPARAFTPPRSSTTTARWT